MDTLRLLRIIAFLEGVSFLILVFVAVPLKHLAGMPTAVRAVGPLHGVLFVGFLILLARVAPEREWSARRSALAVLAALVPFGTFVLDRHLKAELAGRA